MISAYNLIRFIEAQAGTHPAALFELRTGKKRGHWMWYIFPQIRGLGISETSKFYALDGLAEAEAYIDHPLLGPRLKEFSRQLLHLPSNDATAVFGVPDNMKLRSSMTLFAELPNADPVFQQVLDKFFNGQKDPKTLEILGTYK